MATKIRIQKYIANCGYCARRHAELLIEAKLVSINGRPVKEMGQKIDPEKDEVSINGDIIVPPKNVTIMLHKPTKFITSTNDTHDRLTVMDLVPKQFYIDAVFPVGRLDYETEGLLIMTNNGDLSHQLAHPSFECEKEYFVEAEGKLSDKQFNRLCSGTIVVEKSIVKPAQIHEIEFKNNTTVFNMIIHEGKKRQIRKMVEAISSKVCYLRRVRMGNMELGDLPKGKYKILSETDIKNII
ncbi:MAG: pseudouridine synthase [Planctomycetota bacterium]|nr:MAG: pseudouridine synthase [Planctomycetota bacterium]